MFFLFSLYFICMSCKFLIISTMFYIVYSIHYIFNSIYSFIGLYNFIYRSVQNLNVKHAFKLSWLVRKFHNMLKVTLYIKRLWFWEPQWSQHISHFLASLLCQPQPQYRWFQRQPLYTQFLEQTSNAQAVIIPYSKMEYDEYQ